MTEVIQIEELRIRRERKTYASGKCKHMNLTTDDEGEIVMCDDCGKQVSAFWALQMVAEHYAKAMHKLERDKAAHAASTAKGVTLRAAQRVEQAWRSRTMVPTCPHCKTGIFAEDGFGQTQVSREMELRRLAVAKSRETEGERA